MTDITITGKILSIFRGGSAANIYVADQDNPKKIVYKITFWNDEADYALDSLVKGDEITLAAKVYEIGSNQYGKYIDLRMCKLISMTKIQRTTYQLTTENVAEEDSLPQEGE